MDILTHALIGSAAGAGVLYSHPGLACGLVLGNVVPDLDCFSRLGGKRIFFRFHQTVTHSLSAIGLLIVAALPLFAVGRSVQAEAMVGLAIGMAMHVGTDLTNSYGVRLLWPFSNRRFAFHWIFFIDGPILALTCVALGASWFMRDAAAYMPLNSGSYLTAFLLYVLWRRVIAIKAQQMAHERFPQATRIAVIPTTWSVYQFLICSEVGDQCVTYQVNVRTGEIQGEQSVRILDGEMPASVLELNAWQAMKEMSSHFYAVERRVEDDGETIVCRELRFRNFGTRYGTLTCHVSSSGVVTRTLWEV